MKILVTGATGFVGSVLIPELIKNCGSKSISAFVLSGEKIPESWKDQGIQVFYGNIIDRDSVWKACQGQSHIIHLAGFISYWKKDFAKLKEINRDGVGCIIDACLGSNVERLIHVSSVGTIGFNKNGELANETKPFNWPSNFYYMTSKHQGEKIVENAVKKKGLQAIILNSASIMGPGDPNIHSPYNQVYNMIYKKMLFGAFPGGLAVVDVRDLVAIIIKALKRGKIGEKYLIVGANLTYQNIIKLIGKYAKRRVYPIRLPSSLSTAAGSVLEIISCFNKKRPLLTNAYGRLSGWYTYYSNEKSKKEFSHSYINFEKTIQDTCSFFEKNFL